MSKYRNSTKDGVWFAERKVMGVWIKLPGQKTFDSQREAQTYLNQYIRIARRSA